MTVKEIEAFLDGYHKRQRASWEQTRILAYMTAQPHCKKKISPTEMLPFSWDEERPEAERPGNDPDALQRLREKAKEFNN